MTITRYVFNPLRNCTHTKGNNLVGRIKSKESFELGSVTNSNDIVRNEYININWANMESYLSLT